MTLQKGNIFKNCAFSDENAIRPFITVDPNIRLESMKDFNITAYFTYASRVKTLFSNEVLILFIENKKLLPYLLKLSQQI